VPAGSPPSSGPGRTLTTGVAAGRA
jgi:hypothetical protein